MAKGMSWTADTNAKLFVGALAQLKAANLKLDYKELSEFMGPECTAVAAKLQIQRLRREAGATVAAVDKKEGNDDDAAAGAAPATKRKGTGAGGKGAAKRPKKASKKQDQTEVENEEEVQEETE